MKVKKVKLVVFDWDGTLTQGEQEGSDHVQSIRLAIIGMVAQFIGRRPAERLVQQVRADVLANPHKHGWRHEGRIIASPLPNPLLLLGAVAEEALDRANCGLGHQERDDLLGALFRTSYKYAAVPFRYNAARVLETCFAQVPVYVVTQSVTTSVQPKLRALQQEQNGAVEVFEQLVANVRGEARKHELAPKIKGVEEVFFVPWLDRPIYPRRGSYFNVLDKIRATHGLRWEEMAVVGDIFELDLVLPFLLGARIGLVTDKHTPSYEKALVASNPSRARLIRDLEEVPKFLLR